MEEALVLERLGHAEMLTHNNQQAAYVRKIINVNLL